jgi:O-antigen/teichoic acid export membrane protein
MEAIVNVAFPTSSRHVVRTHRLRGLSQQSIEVLTAIYASALVVVCAASQDSQAAEDCCLAA